MPQEYQKEILKVLIRDHPKDMSIKDIREETGFARDTISRYLGKLRTRGFVKKSRKVGKTRMYTVGPKIEVLLEGTEQGEELYDVLEIT